MADMTDEEYDTLDEWLTNTVPTLGRNGTGYFSGESLQIIALDEGTAKILAAKAMACGKMPSEIIASMICREFKTVP